MYEDERIEGTENEEVETTEVATTTSGGGSDLGKGIVAGAAAVGLIFGAVKGVKWLLSKRKNHKKKVKVKAEVVEDDEYEEPDDSESEDEDTEE